RVAVDGDVRPLVHTGGVVADVPADVDVGLDVQADGEVVHPGRVDDLDAPGRRQGRQLPVEEPIDLPHGRFRQVELGQAADTFHEYPLSGSGSNMLACATPGRWASERNSVATAT